MAFSRPPRSSIPSINLANTMLPSDIISPAESMRRSSSLPRNGPRNSRSSVASQSSMAGNQENKYSTLEKIYEETTRSKRQMRDMHEKEREQWQQQRQEYERRIDNLEDTISTLLRERNMTPGGSTRSQVTSPLANFSSPPSGRTTVPTAVWMGPESTTTRHYSEPVTGPSKQSVNVMAPISESTERRKSVAFDSTAGTSRQTSLPAIPGGQVDPSWDGISFRQPTRRREGIERQSMNDEVSPGADQSTSPPQAIPRPRLLDIPTANMHSEELYHSDAGHTPLARVVGSEGTTGGLTPIAQEEPPLDPVPTLATDARPPNERQDSYFQRVAATAAQTDGTQEQDPALQGALSTRDDPNFLQQVNRALERSIEEQSAEPAEDPEPSPPASRSHTRTISGVEDVPKLRFKTSMNFGTAWGAGGPAREL